MVPQVPEFVPTINEPNVLWMRCRSSLYTRWFDGARWRLKMERAPKGPNFQERVPRGARVLQ
eukprot:247413-Pyramimonas_sp.AAC.1